MDVMVHSFERCKYVFAFKFSLETTKMHSLRMVQHLYNVNMHLSLFVIRYKADINFFFSKEKDEQMKMKMVSDNDGHS